MTIEDFQSLCDTTALYPDKGQNYIYPALGLVSEAGEVADHIKRIERDDGGVVTNEKRADIAGDIGDVMWYLAQLATEFELSLEDIARANIAKLRRRLAAGTIQGHGAR